MVATIASATTAHRKATLRIRVATNQLERHLPPQDDLEADETKVSEAPSTKPKPRQSSVAACALCPTALEAMEFVLRQCMAAIDKKFDALLQTVCILVPLLNEEWERTTRIISLGGPTTARS